MLLSPNEFNLSARCEQILQTINWWSFLIFLFSPENKYVLTFHRTKRQTLFQVQQNYNMPLL